LRGESIQSHALHLFFLAVPDYLDRPSAIAVAAEHPAAVMLGLRLKRLGNLIQETIGGRAIHPVNAVPGGFGRVPSAEKLIAIRDALIEAIPDAEAMLDLIASLPDAGYCHTPTAYAALYSPDSDRYYAGDQLTIVSNGDRATIPAADYRSLTNEKPVAHSHAKHSTFHDKPFMVGSLARLTVNPSRSAAALDKLKLSIPSDNPMDNNKAQAVELVNDLALALDMVERLIHDGVKDEGCVPITPRAGTGVGITEAPRGLLVHSYTYDEQGCVVAADVITPTAMNAASLEQHLRKTVEQSAERDEPTLKKKLQMIARAYDPCISCSVHLIRK
jgi:sulfhydrogenase subunit alpha